MGALGVPRVCMDGTAEIEEEEEGVGVPMGGSKLADGDTVTLIKDLKVKGCTEKDLKQGRA